jgi:NTE family protein
MHINRVFFFFITIVFLCFGFKASAQKVGVVLSGGGAKGLAHIGVLKALEKNHIPIDYIAGTSIGALVGGMYASGMTPDQIEAYVGSDEFQDAANGIIDENYVYYFKKKDENASLLTVKFSHDSVWQTTLPTSIINSQAMDFALLQHLSPAISKAKGNFDSLFVPFRCVAADIESKQQVVFKNGNMGQAIRASMAFPFYYTPVMYNGRMLFDGGLYNNFPSDVMLSDFFPDIIIGSNVSGNEQRPTEDNFISQLKTMVANISNYTVSCDNGILIEPQVENVGLLDFDKNEYIIQQGLKATDEKMEVIKQMIQRRSNAETLAAKRKVFNDSQPGIVVSNVLVNGINTRQAAYVKKTINPTRTEELDLASLKKNYFKLIADDNIKRIFPSVVFDPKTGFYDLQLNIKKGNNLQTQFGGNLSSRPISEGFVGLQYNLWGSKPIVFSANTYFGKLYNSRQVHGRIDFPYRVPFYLEVGYTANQFDFFTSSTSFLEDIKPSYLIQSDQTLKIILGLPARSKGKFNIGFEIGTIKNQYYQTHSFLKKDTADQTNFKMVSPFVSFERNTLNRKMYANEGTFLSLKARYVTGIEYGIPGSTSISRTEITENHQWYNIKGVYQDYYKRKGRLKLGADIEGVMSNQPFFGNYTASVLSAPAFQPLNDSKTFFIETFRVQSYVGYGTINVISLQKNVDLRIEGYVFQPYMEILPQPDFTTKSGLPFNKRYFLANAAVVYNTFVGPLCLSLSYYDQQTHPLSLMFHFGYIIFNKRALE